MEPEQSGRQGEQQREREERRGLHFAGEGLTEALEVVPPRQMTVQEVHRREVPEGLGDEAHVGVDHRTSAGDVTDDGRDVGRPPDGADVGLADQVQAVADQHGEQDQQQGTGGGWQTPVEGVEPAPR